MAREKANNFAFVGIEPPERCASFQNASTSEARPDTVMSVSELLTAGSFPVGSHKETSTLESSEAVRGEAAQQILHLLYCPQFIDIMSINGFR